jgi:hypothetical protein
LETEVNLDPDPNPELITDLDYLTNNLESGRIRMHNTEMWYSYAREKWEGKMVLGPKNTVCTMDP